MHHHVRHDEPASASGGARRARWLFIAFVVLALIYLIAEHRAHLVGALPFLVILACPLLHFFMPGGHGSHGSHSHGERGGGEKRIETTRSTR